MTPPTPQTELSAQSRLTRIGKLGYLDFFGLSAPPFHNTSGTDSDFTSASLTQARTRLLAALARPDGGILLLDGPAGSGKTTLVDQVIAAQDEDLVVTRLNRTRLEPGDFMQLLLLGFRIETPTGTDLAGLLDAFAHFLHQQQEAGHPVVLVIDEAHQLEPDVVALLAQLIERQTGTRSRFSIILIGRETLEQTLGLAEDQRLQGLVRCRCRLSTLDAVGTADYIRHQLAAAGRRDDNPFTDGAMIRIHQHTCGNMRLINTLCDFILFNASLGQVRRIGIELVQTTFNALQWEPARCDETDQPPVTEVDETGMALVLEFDDDRRYTIDKDTVTIGRSRENDICIRDPRISRQHARLIRNRKGLSLEDLGSLNGVYVNGERIKIRLLRDGDLVTIEEHRIRFSDTR